MARETVRYQDRLTEGPGTTDGLPVIKGTAISVDRVLARLADNPDLSGLLSDFPELTREDVQAVLAYAHARVVDKPTFVSPRDFYREATERGDIRSILAALAK